MKVVQVILALILPPLAVATRERLGFAFWINLALTLIGWLPGVVHALYVVLRKEPEPMPPRRERTTSELQQPAA